MKLKTLREKEARKIVVTRGTMKRRETRMEANSIAASRNTMLNRRTKLPKSN